MFCAPNPRSGDYSEAQLLRVNRQAIALRRFYELLSNAVNRYRESGELYLVVSLASEAGKALADETVGGSTVRLWHAEYMLST